MCNAGLNLNMLALASATTNALPAFPLFLLPLKQYNNQDAVLDHTD